jgi:hypothetical protein
LVSFIGKISDFAAFSEAITNFKFFPGRFSPILSGIFLSGEVVTVALILAGGKLLIFGFTLAILMLITFSLALAFVLIRKIQTPCNCFGPSTKLVSSYDLLRNAGFIACSSIGLGVSNQSHNLNFAYWMLAAALASIFVLVCLNLRDLLEFAHE